MYLVPAEMETIQLEKKVIENQGDLLVKLEVIS
jgi:hypothetical protein